MATVTLENAQVELPDLLARAERGEEIIITRPERPAVRLSIVAGGVAETPAPKRVPGALAHLRDKIPESFFLDPIYSDDELREIEEKSIFPDDDQR